MPNRNLLDNWYFVGNFNAGYFPINQRLQTTYSGVNDTSIDRWKTGLNTKITIGSDGVVFTDNGNPSDGVTTRPTELLQFVFPIANFIGMTLTFSCLTKEYGLDYLTTTITSEFPGKSKTSPGVANLLIGKASSNNCLYVRIGANNFPAGQSATVIAMKLEVGEQQTLAHQDSSGNWILNDIPNYQQELAKCQRYYFRFFPYWKVIGWGYRTTIAENGNPSATIYVPIPVPLRTTPSLKVSDYSKLFLQKDDGSSSDGITSASVVLVSNELNSVCLNLILPTVNKDPIRTYYQLYCNAPAEGDYDSMPVSIELDATW